MGNAVRPRRLSARVLAVALAVGLGGLLVGLSVAPSTLPGDTFHVRLKAVAGATVVVGTSDGEAAQLSLADTVRPFAAGLLAVAPVPLVLFLGGMLVVRTSDFCSSLAATTLPAAGCRGPPPSS